MNIAIEETQLDKYIVTAGYDRRLDYAFMVIEDKETMNMEYSNMYEPNFRDIKDFDFFYKIAKERFGLDLFDISDAVTVFKINTEQPIELFKTRLADEGLSHLINCMNY